MKIFTVACLLAAATLAAEPVAQKNPLPSGELQQALSAQAQRVQSGTRDTTALVADLRRIAPQGDPVAQFMLATLIATKERDQALALLKKSSAAGCAGAAGMVGAILASNEDREAGEWIMRGAKAGDTGAQLFLAGAYKGGILGLPQNLVESFAWATVAQNNAPNLSMRQAAANMVGGLLVSTPPDALDGAGTRIATLMNQTPKVSFYLCGFSLP
jgi:TPR repeat protein